MSRPKDQLLVIAVLVIGLLAASMASAHGGDTTRIHACINNSSGTIHVVGPDGACNGNEMAVDWNIQGVAGLSARRVMGAKSSREGGIAPPLGLLQNDM